jgi:GNAT superfamily N-acetyltransferase
MINTPLSLFTNYHKTACLYFESIAINQLQDRNMQAFATGIPNADFNVVISTELEIKDIHKNIFKVKRFFEKHKVPWSWIIDKSSLTQDLEECLEKQGLKYKGIFPSMFLDLEAFETDPGIKKFDIRKVSGLTGLKEWIIPIKEGFEATEESTAMIVKRNAITKDCSLVKLQYYVIYHDNQPIASATLSLSKEGVRLNNVATCLKFQRQGFASAVVAYALDNAKKVGHKYCFLNSSIKGKEVYRRLGFNDLSSHKTYVLAVDNKKS